MLTLMLAASALTSAAQAQAVREPSWRPVGDSVWLGAAVGISGFSELGKDFLAKDEGWYPESASFDPTWDEAQWARGRRLRKTSDVLLYGGMAAGMLAPVGYGWGQIKDVGVMGQVMSTNLLLTNLFKLTIGEERPYTRLDPAAMKQHDPGLYESVVATEDPVTYVADSRMSMPSGHVSMFSACLFGTVTSLAFLYADPMSEWGGQDWALWGGGYALAAGGAVYMGHLRYASGKHHIRDTLFGGVLGTVVGVGVPTLHFVGPWVPEAESAPSQRVNIGWSGSF